MVSVALKLFCVFDCVCVYLLKSSRVVQISEAAACDPRSNLGKSSHYRSPARVGWTNLVKSVVQVDVSAKI